MPRTDIPAELRPGFHPSGPFRALIDEDPFAYFDDPTNETRAPSPYFDPAYYRAQNPDCPDATHPLLHYLLRHLSGEERPALPWFDAASYARLNPDVAQAGAATLLHFALHGDAERRAPSDRFDAQYYTRAYLPLEAARPFRHFMTIGKDAGHLPRAPQRPPGALASAIRAAHDRHPRPLLLISHDARQAGAPLSLRDLGRALRNRGWLPMTLMLEGGPLSADFADLGPCFNLAEGWDIADLAQLRGVATIGSTVVCAHALAQLPPETARVLLVQEMVEYARDHAHLDAIDTAIRGGTTAVFLRDFIRDAYRDALPDDVPDQNLRTVFQGIVSRHVGCAPRLARARAMRDAPHVIGGGYGDHRKGFDRFVQTAQILHQRRPDIRFTWLGDVGVWGREQLAKAHGLSIFLPGFVDNYPAWLAGADLFLLTSRQDPGPTLVVESLLQGAGLVFFDGDVGLKDMIAPYGPMVQTPEGAAEAVLLTLAEDTAQARRARRQDVAGQNDFTRYVDQIEELLTST